MSFAVDIQNIIQHKYYLNLDQILSNFKFMTEPKETTHFLIKQLFQRLNTI